MQVSPAKDSYAWLPRKCDYRTDTRTDRQTPDKVIPIRYFASQATQQRKSHWSLSEQTVFPLMYRTDEQSIFSMRYIRKFNIEILIIAPPPPPVGNSGDGFDSAFESGF